VNEQMKPHINKDKACRKQENYKKGEKADLVVTHPEKRVN
jgi:hypothetical protein